MSGTLELISSFNTHLSHSRQWFSIHIMSNAHGILAPRCALKVPTHPWRSRHSTPQRATTVRWWALSWLAADRLQGFAQPSETVTPDTVPLLTANRGRRPALPTSPSGRTWNRLDRSQATKQVNLCQRCMNYGSPAMTGITRALMSCCVTTSTIAILRHSISLWY